MKIKAVVMKRDRTNLVKVIPRRKVNDGCFSVAGGKYMIHPDRFMITSVRILGIFPRTYATFYYREGHTNPLPVPHFPQVEDSSIASAEELEAIFNPWFLRVISQGADDKYEKIKMYAMVAIGFATIWIGWKYNGMAENVEELRMGMETLKGAIGNGTGAQ